VGDLDNRQEHLSLLSETGRIRLTKEQRDTIERQLRGVHLTLDEPAKPDSEATMDLPILARKKGRK